MDPRPLTLPEQRSIDGKPFPLVLTGDGSLDDLLAWLRDHQGDLRQRLLEHGAVLLRGFPVPDASAFEAIVDAAGFEGMPYVGGAAPRSVVSQRVLTSNESPPEEPIPFHHEMSQVPEPPAYICFYCDIPPAEGGETPICHSARAYERFVAIDPEFAANVEAQGIRYIRVMPDQDDPSSAIGRSWRSTFQTEDKAEAEAAMADAGMTWTWLDDGNLRTETKPLPAIRTDARSGKKTFFNSLVAAYTGWIDSRNVPSESVRLGDGSPVNGEAVLATAEALHEEAVAFRWQQGDVLLIDNHLVLHSRRPFKGSRRILASVAAR